MLTRSATTRNPVFDYIAWGMSRVVVLLAGFWSFGRPLPITVVECATQ